MLVFPIYLSILTNLLMLPFALLLFPLLCQKKSAVNEVDYHNKLRQSDLALDKWWVTQCGWLRLCTTVVMGMNITNCWKLFSYGVKRDHYDKLIGIREFSEKLAQYFFNNPFSTDRGTPSNNIPPLDEFDDVDTFSTCRALHFSIYVSPSAAVRTIFDMTLNSASSISIGSQHIAQKEEAKQGGRYNRLTRCYCSGKLPNGKRCLQIRLWFCKGCNGFNNKRVYYCQQVHRNCFEMRHDSLVRIP